MSVARTIYGSSAAITCTLASLASDANLSTGRCGTAIDLTAQSTFPIDVLVSGSIVVSSLSTTTVVTSQIRVYAAGAAGSTVYTGGLSTSDAGFTFSGNEQAQLPVLAVIGISTTPQPLTAGQTYAFGPTSLAQCFGGILPEMFNVWVVHNTGAALNASGHVLSYIPVYFASS